MIQIEEKEIIKGIDEAYKKAGSNAYFGNGFQAGVDFALERVKNLTIHDVNSRLPFKEELDKMCEHYIQVTEEEDKIKSHDNTMADKVKHWCKWIKVFAKENGY
jgi:hypothetical protein